MSVVIISGPGGSVTFPNGIVGKIVSFSGSHNLTIPETTGFSDLGNRTYVATAQSVSGTCALELETGAGAPPMVSSGFASTSPDFTQYNVASMILQFAAGATWTFNAVAHIQSFSRVHDGLAYATVSFQSSGAIAQTWA